MMTMKETMVPYPELKRQHGEAIHIMKWSAVVGSCLWAVHWLLPYLQSLEIFPAFFAMLEENLPVLVISFVLRWGLTLCAVWYLGVSGELWLRLRRRQHPRGTPAVLEQGRIGEAKDRLKALQEACGGPDPFAVRELDVRVQVFTPAADLPRKDGLLEWKADGTALIPLSGKQSIRLAEGRDGPEIIGLVDMGTAGRPSYREAACPLKPHEPLVIRRGEGAESRIHFALTRLKDEPSESGGNRYD